MRILWLLMGGTSSLGQDNVGAIIEVVLLLGHIYKKFPKNIFKKIFTIKKAL